MSEPRRGATATWLGVGLLLLSFSVTFGTNVGLSLVLERSGAGRLPPLMMVNAALLAASTSAVGKWGRGAALRALATTLVGSAALAGASIFIAGRWAEDALYLVAHVIGELATALFWSLANELFDARAAKRVFPRVGAAGTAGAAIAGFAAQRWAAALGSRGLVLAWLASLGAATVWALVLARRVERTSASAPMPTAVGSRIDRPADEDRRLVSALSVGLVSVIAATLVARYLYSRALADTYGGDAVEIARVNGLCTGIGSVVTALVQLLVTPVLLARLGLGRTALVYPLLLSCAFALSVARFDLTSGVAAFVVATVIRRAVQGPVESVMPTGLMPAHAARTVLMLTAVGAPIGMLLAGVVLSLAKSGSAAIDALLGLGLAATLLATNVWRTSAYHGALRLRLAKGGSELRLRLASLVGTTGDVEAILSRELAPDDPALLERLETLARAQREAQASRPNVHAWDPDGPLARIVDARLAEAHRLTSALARLPSVAASPGVERLWRAAIEHRIAEDLRAMLLALRAGTGQSDFDRLTPRLFDVDARTRSAAVDILDRLCPSDLRPLLVPLVERVGLAEASQRAAKRYGPPAADPIDDLLATSDPWVRACTAYALSAIGASPYRAKLEALADSPDRFLRLATSRALTGVASAQCGASSR